MDKNPLIIEPKDLNNQLDDPNLLLVDVRSTDSYLKNHIPGAINLLPSELICGIKPALGKLPYLDDLNRIFSRIGYTRDKYVVSYDDEGGGWAGRLVWTLHVIGHQNCSILNGGLVAWDLEKYSLTQEATRHSTSDARLKIDKTPIADKEEVLMALQSNETTIWDARSADEFVGRKVVALRGGHIPGAINLDWLDTMDTDRGLRIRSDIEQLLIDRGIHKDKSVITHCQSHHRSALAYVIGKSLGYDIKGYDGSWAEWGNDSTLPVESG